jgi:glutathione synthase/RimK-type ligase-like ATP-grasp enzyme
MIMADSERIAAFLALAAQRVAAADEEAAKAACLEALKLDPTHFEALNELGALAYATGYREAALTAYRAAVAHHPGNPVGRINLGNLLYQAEDYAGARREYAAALAADPDHAAAHQGLARTLDAEGEGVLAERHFALGFRGHAVVPQRYRGRGRGIPLLLLASVRAGNIRTQEIIDDRRYAVTWLYAEYADLRGPLPAHALVFNAIGDADLCAVALARAAALLAGSDRPVVNPPERVLGTGREAVATRLAAIAGVAAPRVRRVGRDDLAGLATPGFPLLLRAPGFHTGRHFVRVDSAAALAAAVAALPGPDVLSIEWLDARGADGRYRKYRVLFIGGVLYPLHLAIGREWKVHYFNAEMAASAECRAEERRFLENMAGVVGPLAMAALGAIAATLGLDYGGIDFGLDAEGRLLLFEANATMVILPPGPEPMWDYRRAPIARALGAARALIAARAPPAA